MYAGINIQVDLRAFFDFGFLAHNEGSGQYGYSWMRASVRSRQEAERVGSGPRDELKRYLDSPLEEVNGVVAWWGVSRFGFHPDIHSNRFKLYSITHSNTQPFLAWPVIILLFKGLLHLRSEHFQAEEPLELPNATASV
jgi:hypothetical protein